MSNELAKKQWAIMVNGGLIAWEDDTQVKHLKSLIINGVETIELSDGSMVNTKNMNILSPQAYDILSREKRGQWKCKYNNWHNRNDHCECGRMH